MFIKIMKNALFILGLVFIMSCDFTPSNGDIQEFSKWNSGTSQWETYSFQPPSGTKNVSVNNDGTYMIAWTDSNKLYHFNDTNDTWEIVLGTPPLDTEQVLPGGSKIWLRKTDRSIWSIDGSGNISDESITTPINTLELIPDTTYHTVVLSNNSIEYYNTIWTDTTYTVPSNYVEYIGYVSASNRYIRLSDGLIYDLTLSTGTATSLNITVPSDVKSTVNYNGDFLVLH